MQTLLFDPAWSAADGALDRLARTRIEIAGRALPSFQLLGAIGLACGVAFALTAGALLGLLLPVVCFATLAGVAGAAASAMVAKIWTGRERFVYYRETLAAVAASAAAVALTGQPVLPYLDVAAVSVALVGAFGRTGCLMVGCCHGRPCAWGIAYGAAHVAEGFPSYYAGARLLPVQALESLLQALLACACAALLFSGTSPGTTAASYALAYGTGRMLLETGRGDHRVFHHGLSRAQWTSLGLAAAVLALEEAAVLEFHAWHALLALCTLGTAIALLARSRAPGMRAARLLRADHLDEFATLVMGIAAEPPEDAQVLRTSAGLLVSGGRCGSGSRAVLHFTFSDAALGLAEPTAGRLAELVLRMLAPAGAAQLVYRDGIAHLVIPRQVDRASGRSS